MKRAYQILRGAYGPLKKGQKVMEQAKLNPGAAYELITYTEQSQRWYVIRVGTAITDDAGKVHYLSQPVLKTVHLVKASDMVRMTKKTYGG